LILDEKEKDDLIVKLKKEKEEEKANIEKDPLLFRAIETNRIVL